MINVVSGEASSYAKEMHDVCTHPVVNIQTVKHKKITRYFHRYMTKKKAREFHRYMGTSRGLSSIV